MNGQNAQQHRTIPRHLHLRPFKRIESRIFRDTELSDYIQNPILWNCPHKFDYVASVVRVGRQYLDGRYLFTFYNCQDPKCKEACNGTSMSIVY